MKLQKVAALCTQTGIFHLHDQPDENGEVARQWLGDGYAAYDINLTYYIPQQSTKSGTEIAAAVQAAVDKYIAWQCGKLGRDINPSKLISLLMQTGIKRVDVVSPPFTHLRDGNPALGADMGYDSTEMVPQLAQVNTGGIQILDGGYEDE